MQSQFILTQGDLKVNCDLCTPQYAQVQRLVLSVHGLTGSIHDQIQVGIAEEMELFDSAVLRFDFPGHGQNPTAGDCFTLKNCVDALLMAAQELRSRFAQVEDLCIFATGFGAYVTLTALQRLQSLPGKLKLVLQTPAIKMHETLLSMIQMSESTFRAMDRITFPTNPPLTVTYRLYKELEDNTLPGQHPIPMLILHGQEDDYIKMEDIRRFHLDNEQSRLVIIPGASHRFMEDGAWDMVLDLTRDWFSFEQVLLTDCD